MATSGNDQGMDFTYASVGVNDGADLPAYAWPGGYPVVYITRDGCVLCADCATKQVKRNEESAAEWRADGVMDPQDFAATDILAGTGIHWEGPAEICEDCNRVIESAYGDPEEEEELPR